MQASAVILNWKRPEAAEQVVSSLVKCPRISEIIVFNNSRTGNFPGARVICSPQNYCTLGRFLAASLAEHELIYTQDDDVLVQNIPEILDAFDGESIVAALPDDGTSKHYTWHTVANRGYMDLGFGSCFHRSWVSVLDDYRAQYGDDELLSRKADKVFTAMHGRWKILRSRIVRMTDKHGRQYGQDANSLYVRPDHKRLTELALERVRELKSARRAPESALEPR